MPDPEDGNETPPSSIPNAPLTISHMADLTSKTASLSLQRDESPAETSEPSKPSSASTSKPKKKKKPIADSWEDDLSSSSSSSSDDAEPSTSSSTPTPPAPTHVTPTHEEAYLYDPSLHSRASP